MILQSIKKFHDWQENLYKNKCSGNFIGVHVTHYIDELLTDMGLPTNRCNNFITENLTPIWADKYKNLREELREKNIGKKPIKKFYFSGSLFLSICFLFLVYKIFL